MEKMLKTTISQRQTITIAQGNDDKGLIYYFKCWGKCSVLLLY